jgi:hypothetical protein
MNAQSFCRSYGMDLATLESDHEQNYFLNICGNNYRDLGDATHIGGVFKNNEWFWITSHKKVDYKLKFMHPHVPNDNKDCLQMVKHRGTKEFFFGRTNCFNGDVQKFVCQKLVAPKLKR